MLVHYSCLDLVKHKPDSSAIFDMFNKLASPTSEQI